MFGIFSRFLRRESTALRSGQAEQGGFSFIELMLVVTITIIIAAVAIPKLTTAIQNLRSGGDMRSLSSEIVLAKMRAAADYTQTRVYADLTGNTFRLDLYNSATASWATEANTTAIPLSTGVSFGFGSIASPPSNTQSTLGQAPLCAVTTGSGTVSNTACVVFNSRGVPIDSTGAPTANDAIYVTDGNAVYGITISATGLIQSWRIDSNSTNWKSR